MTPQQIALVQSSLQSVAPIASKAPDLFYDRLFEIAPEVRQLFPADLSAQKLPGDGRQQSASAGCSSAEPAPTRRADRNYAVSADHYGPLGAALLWTLEQGLGSAFSPEVRAAWTKAYRALAGVMRQGSLFVN
jgi:hemoglobin-like flavoprotein